MTQLGERDAVEVDAQPAEMFAEEPTAADADADDEPRVIGAGGPPRANDRARHHPDAPATTHVHAGAPTVAAAATPLVAVVAARTATGTPPLAPTTPDAAAAVANKKPYVAPAAATYPYGAGSRTYSPNERNNTRPTNPPVKSTSAAPVAIARAVLDASRVRASPPPPGNHHSVPDSAPINKNTTGKENNIARPQRCSKVATGESPNSVGACAAAYDRKGTNANAIACVAASRGAKMTSRRAARLAATFVSRVSPGSYPRWSRNEEGAGTEKAR